MGGVLCQRDDRDGFDGFPQVEPDVDEAETTERASTEKSQSTAIQPRKPSTDNNRSQTHQRANKE